MSARGCKEQSPSGGGRDIFLALFLSLFAIISGYAAAQRAGDAEKDAVGELDAPPPSPGEAVEEILLPLGASRIGRDRVQSWYLQLPADALFIGRTAAVKPEAAQRLRLALAALVSRGTEPHRVFVLSLAAEEPARPLELARIEALASVLAAASSGVDVSLALGTQAEPVLIRIADASR